MFTMKLQATIVHFSGFVTCDSYMLVKYKDEPSRLWQVVFVADNGTFGLNNPPLFFFRHIKTLVNDDILLPKEWIQ